MNDIIKKIVTLITLLATMGVIVSCSGDEGEQGPQGEQGIQGIPGKDGSVIISGSGIPEATTGNIGDMYLDMNTSNLYGPKAENGWGTPLSLKGADGVDGQDGADGQDGQDGVDGADGQDGVDGADGQDGSVILNGNGAPSISLGIVGDYYLDSTTGDLYGPKTSNSWGIPINLKGTANVVATTWVDYDWNSTNSNTVKIMKYIVPDPVLAAIGYNSLYDFSDEGGAILVYGKNYGANYFTPFSYEFRNGSYKVYPTSTGNILWIHLNSIDGNDLRDIEYDSAKGNKFRYVLIPSGAQLSGKGIDKESLLGLSWEEVREKFNLKG